MMKKSGPKAKITNSLIAEVITGILLVTAAITCGFVYLFILISR